MNAENLSLTPQTDHAEWSSNSLRLFYLRTLLDYASRSKHDLRFQRRIYPDKRPEHIKRSHPAEAKEYLMSSKKACFEWAPPARLGADDKIQWEAARTNLAHQIKDPGIGQKANTKRAEHLLRMIDAIAGDDVLESWRNDQSILPERLQRSQSNPAADAIYRLISRGQSRSFRDNAVLRVGKYLFASRVLNKVNLLRSLGPPSKQPVAIAGSTGEGNAVTRALKDFVREIHPETNQEGEACEVRKCKQWWNEGKVWKLLADAIDPAILLFIPSGHEIAGSYRIWDSE